MTRVLITGSSGQVGQALIRSAPKNAELLTPSRRECDLSNPEQVRAYLHRLSPSAILHAGAYTAVDKAESEPALAYAVNVSSTAVMAAFAGKVNIPLLYVSTDYVFDGSGQRPHSEEAAVRPLSVYGQTKLAGELVVQCLARRHTILRTSWVFSSDGVNFVKRMLELGRSRESLSIVMDQHGAPTPAAAIADALWNLLKRHTNSQSPPPSLLHFSGKPATTWYDFAHVIFETARTRGYKPPALHAIPTSAYPTPARRPAWAVLDCTAIARLGIAQPDWRQALDELIPQLLTVS